MVKRGLAGVVLALLALLTFPACNEILGINEHVLLEAGGPGDGGPFTEGGPGGGADTGAGVGVGIGAE